MKILHEKKVQQECSKRVCKIVEDHASNGKLWWF